MSQSFGVYLSIINLSDINLIVCAVIDTTFNATRTSLKTGPVVTSDCFGFTAPCGIFQAPEEDAEATDVALTDLGVPNPNTPTGLPHNTESVDKSLELASPSELSQECNRRPATVGTDGGKAWPKPINDRGCNHVEDTWHNNKNLETAASQVGGDSKTFKRLGKSALYDPMSEEECDNTLKRMMTIAEGTGAKTFAKQMYEKRERRCFAYTSKHFICSLKGGMARSEQSMSKLKGAGHEKKTMRKFSIAELLEKHLEYDVENYIESVTEALEKCIL